MTKWEREAGRGASAGKGGVILRDSSWSLRRVGIGTLWQTGKRCAVKSSDIAPDGSEHFIRYSY